MSKQAVGTCGLCGGRVSVESPYWSIIPPTPTCEECGAVVADNGPVLPMKPTKRPVLTTTTTDRIQIIPDWEKAR